MKVFGLIGEKLSHSLSPIIHKSIYEYIGIDATYSLYQVKQGHLRGAAEGIKALDLTGVNVTIPYKVDIMEFLDSISPESQKIGAVNTIFNNNGHLVGYNTDYTGFGRMLKKYNLNMTNKDAVILGSGGAAKSVIAYLEDNGTSSITIVTRDVSKAGIKGNYKTIDYNQLSLLSDAELLINCTPVGMHPHVDSSPVGQNIVSSFRAVVDLVYNPFCTKLMKQAVFQGIPAYNGLYMLVAQAVAAAEIWNGIDIDETIVDAIYEQLAQSTMK